MEYQTRGSVIVTILVSVLMCFLTLYSSQIYFTTQITLDFTNETISNNPESDGYPRKHLHPSCGQTSQRTAIPSHHSTQNYDNSTTNMSYVKEYQKHRVANIRHECSKPTVCNHSPINRRSFRFYHSTKYKFLYCKVAKIGSTFWSQVFKILHEDNYNSDSIFQGRGYLHGRMDKYYSHLSYNYRTRYPAIIPARNPFGRLFSAYIDKSYLRLIPELNHDVRTKYLPQNETAHARNTTNAHVQNATTCSADVTFEEFLKYIIRTKEFGRSSDMNIHWKPIYSLCMPCSVNVSIVVLKETNKQDVKYALDTLHIHSEEKEEILSLMNENRINSTIPGVIKTSYRKVEHTCFSSLELAQRLWKAFKIQGYIRDNLPFPLHVLNETTVENSDFVISLILKTIEKNPMSLDEITAQRNQALVKAYCNISKETISKISEIYEQDFKLFGYSMVPPN